MPRLKALTAALREDGADAMLLTGAVSIQYVTGTVGLEGKCILFADGTAVFITDGRYIESAEKLLAPKGFSVVLYAGACSGRDYPQTILEQHQVKKLMYEDDVLTVSEFAAMREMLSCTLTPVGNRIRALRARKSEAEIRCMEKAQRIAESALQMLLPRLCTGITEKKAAALLDYFMAVQGSEKPSFDTILLFGENTSKPHGIPTDRELREGDLILADFGAVWQGYHSDMTRTFAYGRADEETRTVYETVLQAQQAAHNMAKAGLLCCDMHKAAAEVIEKAGYGAYFTHALGHSVGLEIHESPVASLRCEEPLRNGVVMTDEPGIYLAGKFGVRIEDMLVIDGDTPRCLTKFPKEFTVLPVREPDETDI